MELINYGEDPVEDASPNNWPFAAFEKYFKDIFFKVHKVGGGVKWTMREKTCLSRMLKEFDGEEVAAMIDEWHLSNTDTMKSANFMLFYANREKAYIQLAKRRTKGEYRWE